MGLAVDIGLVNTPLETIYEIRDVLRRMQDSGDILFIGKRRQLVFHVVPHPSRLEYFNNVYLKAVGEPLTSRSAGVVAFLGAPPLMPAQLTPGVTTEIIGVFPAEGPIQNLWVETGTEIGAASVSAERSDGRLPGARWLTLFAAVAACLVLIVRPSSTHTTISPPADAGH
jgi:hypothetical protein